jgi:hypothetical protein
MDITAPADFAQNLISAFLSNTSTLNFPLPVAHNFSGTNEYRRNRNIKSADGRIRRGEPLTSNIPIHNSSFILQPFVSPSSFLILTSYFFLAPSALSPSHRKKS